MAGSATKEGVPRAGLRAGGAQPKAAEHERCSISSRWACARTSYPESRCSWAQRCNCTAAELAAVAAPRRAKRTRTA
eukprot:513206-Pyramimonas_sp.AAC.1